jgi:prepilin-type N-terminal cleavage/methylation domain-containing protein
MKNKGFTLIEILVTTALFVAIFSIISGLFFSALKVQSRALASQNLIKESSYVMEYMSRQLRMAQKSESGNGKDCTFPPDYRNYLVNGEGNSIKFRNYSDECWTFFLDVGQGRLKVIRNDGINPPLEDFLTSPDLKVLSFKINLSGDDPAEGPGAQIQPRITILLKIQGQGGQGQRIEKMPEIQIQTTVSQRNLDL